MGTSFEDILNRMRNAPHVGVPAVTNPKLPTKVEQDVAAFEARQREMPTFHFGNDSQLGALVERMKKTPHQCTTYADSAFKKRVLTYKSTNATLLDSNDVWKEARIEEGVLRVHWYFVNREALNLTQIEESHISELKHDSSLSYSRLIVTVALDDTTREDYKEFVQAELQKAVEIINRNRLIPSIKQGTLHELKLEINFYNIRYFDAEEQDLYFTPKDIEIYTVGRSDNVFNEASNDITRTKFFGDKKHKLDNIDDMNQWYCECTGLYYLWKHSKAKIVGLEHYRRYFINKKHQCLRSKEIKELLSKYDCICASYKKNIKRYDFLYRAKFKTVKAECDKFWRYAKLDTRKYGTTIADTANCNMFIASSGLLNEYASYIFPLIQKWMKESRFNKGKNKRVIGYIFETTFGYWLEVIAKKRVCYSDLNTLETQTQKMPVSNNKNINYAYLTKLYVAYHKPELKAKLRSKQFDVLYDTTSTMDGDSLNNLHDFFGEFVQMYYVWKNNKYSPYVGFANWRDQLDIPQTVNRRFTPQKKVCERRTLRGGFIFSHGEPLYKEMITSIKKLHGENSKYLAPFEGTTFYMGGHGIYKWDFFVKCIEFTWGVMNDIITRNNLSTYEDYVKFSDRMLKKRTDWCHPDQKQDHQYLFFGYIFERLITVFIVANGGEK